MRRGYMPATKPFVIDNNIPRPVAFHIQNLDALHIIEFHFKPGFMPVPCRSICRSLAVSSVCRIVSSADRRYVLASSHQNTCVSACSERLWRRG